MSKRRYDSGTKSVVWLTVDYSPEAGRWYIHTTYPAFINRKLAKEFTKIEGNEIIYMVRGFDNYTDCKGFAITYHKAKRDGIVRRIRLD